MSHTPGPWYVNGDCIEADGPEGPRDVTVAVVHLNESIDADARLIASAPELLNACKYLLDNAEAAGWSEFMLADARAAIVKAEGRSE
jgi:hypothetical protein